MIKTLLLLAVPLLALAQPKPIAQLQPIVVQLEPGDVIGQPLIGLDSATYQISRHAVEAIPLVDAALADRDRQIAVMGQQLSASLDANQLLQRDLASQEADYQQLLAAGRRIAGKPPARPLLLDTHTFIGCFVGLVVGGLLVFTH